MAKYVCDLDPFVTIGSWPSYQNKSDSRSGNRLALAQNLIPPAFLGTARG